MERDNRTHHLDQLALSGHHRVDVFVGHWDPVDHADVVVAFDVRDPWRPGGFASIPRLRAVTLAKTLWLKSSGCAVVDVRGHAKSAEKIDAAALRG